MTFHKNLPDNCPPKDAAPMTGVLYRKIDGEIPQKSDFYSLRELERTCTGNECKCWGISVWAELAHVRHALKTYRSFSKRKIVKVNIVDRHGVIKHTGTTVQPEHRTFWRDCDVDFSKFMTIIDPNADEQ